MKLHTVFVHRLPLWMPLCLALLLALAGAGASREENAPGQEQRDEGASKGMRQPAAARGRGLLAEMTSFRTDVPEHPFDIILVSPTQTSITISVATYANSQGFIEYGLEGGAHFVSTEPQTLLAGQPASIVLGDLLADKAYVYRFKHRVEPGPEREVPGDAARDSKTFQTSDWYRFHTPRAPEKRPGGEFVFTIQADSHLDANVTPEVYVQTLVNALADKPDFHIDLGDTFMTDKRGKNFKDTLPQYVAQRYYFGRLCHSAPLFMVLGNHDGEIGYANSGPDSIASWSFNERTKYFPAPMIADDPDGKGFYTGRTSYAKGQGSNYYEFVWGDAHFIVLDPFWFTAARPRGGGGGGGPGRDKKESDIAATDENWSRTLGKEQYDWLTRTLELSRAKYRFVFIHHLVGGLGRANRGGAESSVFFEWGGKNADGSDGFTMHRPGWKMPIHDLLVKHRVSAVFHGHDHLYVRGERDGLVYQCVPQPGNVLGGTRSAAEYGYSNGTIAGSPGYVRVRVGSEQAAVQFVRSALANADDGRRVGRRESEANGTVVQEYRINPATGNQPIGK